LKKRPSFLSLILILLLGLSACEINKLNSAQDHFNNRRYAAAIQELDIYINTGENGALIARSEILRARCYYELGLLAMQKENWELSIRFLKLSNSIESDQALGSIYKTLADKAIAENNPALSLYYVNAILREIPNSELAAEMKARRISFELDTYVDYDAAWQDYMLLYDNYPNNVYEVAARKQILRIIPGKVDYARQLYATGYYSEGLAILFELGKYPVVDGTENNKMIGEAYIGQAESYLKGQDYLEADRFFRIAVQYDPSKKQAVNNRLEQVATLYIQKGNEYLDKRDFDNAMIHYQKTFDIIPNYPVATQAITRLNTMKENIARAVDLNTQAQKAEMGGKFSEALNLYKQAINYDSQPEYRNKAAQMQNLLEAENNPNAFAKKIINEYRNGLLNTRIQSQKQKLLQNYDKTEVRDSGWKLLISTGQFKYEARYDLITPEESYFYVWQVNLRERSITPLNKISENLMR
jgi:Tfp pilus assembly protein PilF